MRKISATFCLLVTFLLSASAQNARPTPIPPIEVPFRMVEGAIWVDVNVNASKPLSFLLDTAAGNDCIDRALAEELKLRIIELGTQANVGTGDSTARMAASPNVDFTVGPARYTGNAIVVPFDGVNRAYGERINGMLGSGFLSHWVATIDYPRQKLILHDNETFDYRGKGRILPLRFIRGGPIVAGTVVIGDKDYSGEFLVDAPFRRGVALTTPFVQKYGLLETIRKRGQRVLAVELIGVAGQSKNWTGRTTTFKIAGFTLPEPITDFAEATAGSMMRQDIAGIIGADILRHFVVTFDYPRKRLILEPADEPKPGEADMAGIVWDSEPPDYQVFRVTRVHENSPASDVGLQAGDVLLSLDGVQATALRKWKLSELLKRPGGEVILRVKRGNNEVEAKLKLRRLI